MRLWVREQAQAGKTGIKKICVEACGCVDGLFCFYRQKRRNVNIPPSCLSRDLLPFSLKTLVVYGINCHKNSELKVGVLFFSI